LNRKIKLKSKGFFVVGTDTGVGKTLVAAGLARFLVNRGLKVGVLKPVASGGMLSEDGKLLQKAARLPDSIYPEIVPVHFCQSLAPYVASWKEGPVPLRKVEKAYKEARKKYDCLVVEGIGGILVPITRDFLAVDWMVKWKLPALVVARAGLGTINHTLLTMEVLQRRNIRVLGVIVNGYKGCEPSEKSNVLALRKLLSVPVFGPLKFDKKYQADLDLLAIDLAQMGLKIG
jgi:dethiobiotin synthetase